MFDDLKKIWATFIEERRQLDVMRGLNIGGRLDRDITSLERQMATVEERAQ